MRNRILKNNLFLIKISFKAAPLYVFMFILEAIVHVLTTFLEFTLGVNFILEAAEFSKPFKEILSFLIFLTAFQIMRLFLGSLIGQRIAPKAKIKIKAAFRSLLYDKAKEIDLENYDNPEFYNNFILSLTEADKQIEKAFKLLESIIQSIMMLITTGSFFMVKDPLSVVFVIIPVIGTFFVMKKINRLSFKIRMERNPHERRRSYAGRVFYLNDYAKEIRLNPNAGVRIEEEFFDENKKIREIDARYAKKNMFYDFMREIIFSGLPQNLFYMLYLLYKAVVLKTLSISNIVVLYNSTYRLKRGFTVFTDVYPIAEEISMYVDKINKFLDMEVKIACTGGLPVSVTPAKLEFRNVSFAYNQADGYILKDINLVIHAGEKCAFVGYNGAGKTTLIKLIMRLYDPTEGVILLGGVDIKLLDIRQYRSLIGTVFQDYRIYAANLLENIIQDIADNSEHEQSRAAQAIRKAGFDERLKSLEKGLDTPLTTEFEADGVNLSGGESQKVAISRVFFKETGMIILDEPSSALDPISEYHLNESMLKNAGGSTVIFISHRLSTTRDADRIFMLENGRIIEYGTHAELVSKGGKYSEMWSAQAGQYRHSQNALSG